MSARYWVLTSNAVYRIGRWCQGFRPVPDYTQLSAGPNMTWVLYEDDEADPSLNGLAVQVWFSWRGDDLAEVFVSHRAPMAIQAPLAAGTDTEPPSPASVPTPDG